MYNIVLFTIHMENSSFHSKINIADKYLIQYLIRIFSFNKIQVSSYHSLLPNKYILLTNYTGKLINGMTNISF